LACCSKESCFFRSSRKSNAGDDNPLSARWRPPRPLEAWKLHGSANGGDLDYAAARLPLNADTDAQLIHSGVLAEADEEQMKKSR